MRFARMMVIPLFMVFGLMAGSMGAIVAQDEDMPTIAVGSKDFTEHVITSHLVALLLEDAGYEVERKFNLGGTVVAHSALVTGEIDLYVEYTGTALVAILGQEVPPRRVARARRSSPFHNRSTTSSLESIRMSSAPSGSIRSVSTTHTR